MSCSDPNLVYLGFAPDDPLSVNIAAAPNTQFRAYLVLANPVNSLGEPVPDIEAFEVMITFDNGAYLFKLSEILPPGSINIGDSSNPANGLDYTVGMATPRPVTDGFLTLVELTFLVLTNDPIEVFLGDSRNGYMQYQDASTHSLVDMYPISGAQNLPSGSINGDVPTCEASVWPELDMGVDILFAGEVNTAGTAQGATDGYDPGLDLPDAYPNLLFPHPEWLSPVGDYFQTDVRAPYDPTRDVKQWTFITTTNFTYQSGSPAPTATIQFAPDFTADEGIGLELATDTGTLDLFPDLSYTYSPGYGPVTRNFTLRVGTEIPEPPALSVGIAATIDGVQDTGTTASTAAGATDGFDSGLDTPKPAPPPADYVQVSFEQPTWPLGPRFLTDVRALFEPMTATKTWPFMVETDKAGNVVLQFDPSFTPAEGIGLSIRDLQSGQVYNLFPDLSYVFQSFGPGTRHFELLVGEVQVPSLTPTERFLPAGWSLVGMPLIPDPGQESLDAVIKDQAPGMAYLFAHGGSAGYQALDGSETAILGEGYWIATDQGFAWTMDGTPSLAPVVVPLEPGWNLMGNPMWFPGPVENIRVVYQNTTYDWQTAVQYGLVTNTVYSYDPVADQYVNTLDMEAWNGYWVDALVDGAGLVFEWNHFLVMPARFRAGGDETATGFTWSTDIHLTDSAAGTRTITIGLSEDATSGFDPVYDLPQPPVSPRGGPVLAIRRPEWDLASGDYFTADVQQLRQEEASWTILATSPNPGPVVLHWDSGDWPEGMDYQLYNPDQNRVVVMSMRDEPVYVLDDISGAPANLVIRTPDMLSGVDDTPVPAFGLRAYPNPFNPLTNIDFTMPRAGTAEIRVFSVRGELVASLEGGRFEAGTHRAVWRGRDRGGRDVPSGSYFARLYVDGESKGEVIKMSLIR